jgi:hypothetical protein
MIPSSSEPNLLPVLAITLLHPWALWFLTLVPLVVALYLFRRRRERLPVSSLFFWRRVLRERNESAFFHRFRHIWSLLLQLLILSLLVAALAKPVRESLLTGADGTVILIDTRARMQAHPSRSSETLWQRALADAIAAAREASANREIAIVELGAESRILLPWTQDPARAEAALKELTPSDASGTSDRAFALVKWLVSHRTGNRRVLTLTPERVPTEFRSDLPAEVQLLERPLGNRVDFPNLGFTRFAAAPVPSNPESYEMVVEFENFGSQPQEGELEISYDGRRMELRPFRLGPGEVFREILSAAPKPSTAGRGWLTAKLSGMSSDSLETDNRAFAVIPPVQRPRVLLVSEGNWFLEKFLESASSVDFELITPPDWRRDFAAQFDVVVFDRFAAPDSDLVGQRAGAIYIGKSPLPEGDRIRLPTITDVESGHPLLAHVNMDDVALLTATSIGSLSNSGGWQLQPLARSADRILLAAGQRGDNSPQRIAILPFALGETDLPLRVAFPMLMHNAIFWCAQRTLDKAPDFQTGTLATFPNTGRVAALPVIDLRAAPALASAPPQFVTRLLRSGFYAYEVGGAIRWATANLEDRAESAIFATPATEPTQARTETRLPVEGARRPEGLNVWQWLGLFALLCVTAEWFLFHTRRTA